MKAIRRISAPLTAQEKARIKSLREQMQRIRPDLEEALSSGDYDGPFQAQASWLVGDVLSRLRDLRERSGISQKQLAVRLRMDVTALSRLESGRQPNPTIQTLARVAEGLGCRLSISLKRAAVNQSTAAPAAQKYRKTG